MDGEMVMDWAMVEYFITAGEANAFLAGLTYGDEPRFVVDPIVIEDDLYVVTFRYADD